MALGETKRVPVSWSEKVMIGRKPGLSDEQAAAAHKLLVAVNPDVEVLVCLVPRKSNVQPCQQNASASWPHHRDVSPARRNVRKGGVAGSLRLLGFEQAFQLGEDAEILLSTSRAFGLNQKWQIEGPNATAKCLHLDGMGLGCFEATNSGHLRHQIHDSQVRRQRKDRAIADSGL